MGKILLRSYNFLCFNFSVFDFWAPYPSHITFLPRPPGVRFFPFIFFFGFFFLLLRPFSDHLSLIVASSYRGPQVSSWAPQEPSSCSNLVAIIIVNAILTRCSVVFFSKYIIKYLLRAELSIFADIIIMCPASQQLSFEFFQYFFRIVFKNPCPLGIFS